MGKEAGGDEYVQYKSGWNLKAWSLDTAKWRAALSRTRQHLGSKSPGQRERRE